MTLTQPISYALNRDSRFSSSSRQCNNCASIRDLEPVKDLPLHLFLEIFEFTEFQTTFQTLKVLGRIVARDTGKLGWKASVDRELTGSSFTRMPPAEILESGFTCDGCPYFQITRGRYHV
jgi:hypothetical protein